MCETINEQRPITFARVDKWQVSTKQSKSQHDCYATTVRETWNQAPGVLDSSDRSVEQRLVLDSAMGVSAERERKFGAFPNDSEWLEVRRKSEEDGPIDASITNTILVPTAFSMVR